MEKPKYFTPEIEDIFVGYEFEFLESGYSYPVELLADNQVKLLSAPTKTEIWKKDIYDVLSFSYPDEEESEEVGNNLKYYIDNKQIRVPYLTTEQIEDEGWEHIASYRDGGTRIFSYNNKKYTYEITFRGRTHLTPSDKIVITEIRETVDRPVRDNIFNGECKDINTLRKLIKLLGI